MDSDRMAVFRAVARCGGFTAAGAALHRTQPAISHAIRGLEEEIGSALFVRLGRRVRLTEAGEILLEHVDVAMASIEVARARIAELQSVDAGSLRIGCSDTTACYVLPPVLEAFCAAHPRVEVRVSNDPSAAILERVAEGEVDIGLVSMPVERRGVVISRLCEREDVAIFSPDHPLAVRKRLRLADLLQYPLLLLDRASTSRHWIDARIAEAGVAPQIAMELASLEVVKRFVGLGFGVSVVPAVSVERDVEAGVLAMRRVFTRAQRRRLGVAHADRGPLAPAAVAFLALARSHLREGA
jgi:DNA-binding transcriptional LysR family regulator